MATGPDPGRSAVRTTGGFNTLAATMVAATAAFALTLALRPSGTPLPWADVWLYNTPMVLAAILAFARSRTAGEVTRPWLLIGVALAADALGGITFWAEEAGLIPSAVVPVSDLLWLVYYPLVFVGLLLLTRRRLSLRLDYAWLDALVVGAGTFAVGLSLLNLVVTPSPEESAIEAVVNALYLVGDLILLVLVLTVIQAFGGRPPRAWWVMLAGFVCVVAADGAYLVQSFDATYVEGGWLDLLWPLSAALIGLAAWQDRSPSAPPRRPRRLTFVGPSLAIVAAAVVLIAFDGDFLPWLTLAMAFTTIVLAVVRLNLDVRQSLRLTEELRKSQIDALTGLRNRRGLLDVPVPRGRSSALVLMDLDAYKDVNDSLGHAAGDRLLETVATRLRAGVRDADILARLGGDEFAVLLWDSETEGGCVAAENLIRALEDPLTLDGVPLLVTACAGVADSEGGRLDLATLLKHADTALYAAKADGPAVVRAFTGDASEQSQERLRIRAEVRAALEAGGQDFVVYYQPMIGIDDGRVLCVESLVRWQHGGATLAPAEFLAEVVRGGEMPTLTRHMLRTSLRELRDNGIDLPVTVNVPPELISDWLIGESADALAILRLPAGALIVEITEEAILKDPSRAAAVLRDLRATGIRILLDDFGTGWSGLSSLRDLIVDGIKVDHSFVSRLTEDPTAASIVRGISQVATDLDLAVIYEGAETAEVLEALRQYPSGYVQGFISARPMPIADLVHWLSLRPGSRSSPAT